VENFQKMDSPIIEDRAQRPIRFGDFVIPSIFILVRVVLHLFSFNHYGYFRDELYYIACSKHLAWGYVDHPPLAIFLLRLVRGVLGDSLFAIRLLPLLAGIGVIVLAAALARKLGGGKFAQALAAGAALAAPVLLGNAGRYYSMNGFDLFFWSLAAYILVLILNENRPRLWLLFGAVAGLGLLNKYSMGFFLFGMVVGLLLSKERKQFAGKWIYLGGMIAVLLFLPHLLWELNHGFPSLEFMRNVTHVKNAPTSPLELFLGQFRETGFGSVPLLLLGLGFFLFHPRAKAVRSLGWMYLVIFPVMALQNAKPYYLSPFFPILFAAGAVLFAELTAGRPWRWFRPALAVVVLLFGAISAPFALPLLPLPAYLSFQNALGVAPRAEENNEMGPLPQYYADMHGWPEMAATVAGVFGRLHAEEKMDCLIYLRNYGEAGAIDFFGPKYGLPRATCAHNSYWNWGPGEWSGTAAIVFGSSRDVEANRRELRSVFAHVELAAFTSCGLAMPYENRRPIFICRGATFSMKKIWTRERFFI
jgi:hypothetical protein